MRKGGGREGEGGERGREEEEVGEVTCSLHITYDICYITVSVPYGLSTSCPKECQSIAPYTGLVGSVKDLK